MEFLYLRPAEAGDRRLLFDWRNDPVVRDHSFNREPVVWDDHVRWFDRLAADPQARQYILIVKESGVCANDVPPDFIVTEKGAASEEKSAPAEGVPVGQIRLQVCDDDPSAYEISYSVAAAFRGRGYGRRLLQMIQEQAPKDLPGIRILVGRVKKDNPASAAAFRSAGYDFAQTPEYYEFRYEIFK